MNGLRGLALSAAMSLVLGGCSSSSTTGSGPGSGMNEPDSGGGSDASTPNDSGTSADSASSTDTGTPSADGATASDTGTPADASGGDGSSCTDKCTSGSEQCAGAQIQQCQKQANGCYDWSAPGECPTNDTCVGNQCVLACANECVDGATQCNGGGLETCSVQSNGCTNWGTAVACPSGETCSGGQCASSCTNQCTVGATQCSGPQLQTCAQQANGCTDWNPAQACPNGTCSAGACCTNDCTVGATQCSGSQVQTCAIQANGCSDWGAATACPSGETCTGAACATPPCTPGATQCSGSVLQVCSSSQMWVQQQVCSQGCSSGACTTTTTCTAQTQRCDGNIVEVCNSTGTAWLEVATCSACSNGVCTGTCTPGATQCNGNVPETCNAGGTGWTAAAACTTTCVDGACSSPALTINANANATIGGTQYIDGDVTITNGSVLTVPSGTTTIYCNNFTLDATSQIVVTPTGNDPRGTGGTSGSCSACYVYCCSATGATAGSGGSYGTQGTGAGSATAGCDVPVYGYYETCNAASSAPAAYAIADNEAATGAAGGTCVGGGPAGMGGGLIAIYCNNITIAGQITANGQSASGCSGGGSGGGVVLRSAGTLSFTGSISVAGGNGGGGVSGYGAGGNGGNGVVKLLYGNADTITGSIVGAKFESFMPPFDVSSATHPNPARWYNDGFSSFDLAWSKPFTNSAGYYYALDTTYGFVPSPSNALYQGTEAHSFAPSALVAGSNDFHVDTVGPSANVGTVEARYTVQMNSTPPTIASSSHPSQTTWYANNSPYFTWTIPHANADVTNFYWVFDPYANTIPDTTGNQIPMNQTTPQNSEQLLLPNEPNGIWFLHVIAQDTMGYLTKQGATYRVQLGAQPMQGSVSGSVTDAVTHNPLAGVTVTLNRGVLSTTTAANGTYSFPSNVYDQTYEASASLTGYKTSAQMITVTGTMTTTANFQLGM